MMVLSLGYVNGIYFNDFIHKHGAILRLLVIAEGTQVKILNQLSKVALRFKVSSTTIQRALHASCENPHFSETASTDVE